MPGNPGGTCLSARASRPRAHPARDDSTPRRRPNREARPERRNVPWGGRLQAPWLARWHPLPPAPSHPGSPTGIARPRPPQTTQPQCSKSASTSRSPVVRRRSRLAAARTRITGATERLAVGQRDAQVPPTRPPVTQGVDGDRNLVARLDGGALPPRADQVVRTVHLDRPGLGLPVIAKDVDLERGVWVRPLELRDRAGDLGF